MRCRNCHSESPESSRFCIEFGAALERRCLKCGVDNLPQARFCEQCGSSLIEPATAEISSVSMTNVAVNGAPRRIDHNGERLSPDGAVLRRDGLDCDRRAIDAEEWRETLAGFHGGAAAAITSFDGYVAKFIGDGVMALFGWPQAQDNEAERAGWAILDAISKLNSEARCERP